ncbi:uncharacterized protein LOC120003447 [Tripterygium wilfordii]|uniref:uncharacterized protein LOC120003447 n=1 Tax=Tripterygium wilfordii TaxID=458696 RepID=UPI0018F81830|nr:uncharacterized protein LOC120003447 [Tripterygium wilfordii]
MAQRLARNNGREVQDRLKKIGEEGFAAIQELYGNQPGRPTRGLHAQPSKPHQYQQQQQQPCVYYGPQVFTVKQKPVISSDQSAEYYGAPQVLKVRQQPEINSDQAAELYGGMVFVDHLARP